MKLKSLYFVISFCLGLNCLAVDKSPRETQEQKEEKKVNEQTDFPEQNSCTAEKISEEPYIGKESQESSGKEKKKEDPESMHEKEHWLFVGNPGAGKSTIINALMGEGIACSGTSPGIGLTTCFNSYEDKKNNRYYLDTPGLADMEIKEKSAKVIENALKQNGLYKIIFILTLESGRVKPEDVATINTVMDAVIISEKRYTILINKIKPKVKKMLQNKDEEKLVRMQLNSGGNKTNSIFFIEYNHELDNEEIDILPLSIEVKNFLRASPVMRINEDQVTVIKEENLEEKTIEFEKQITNMIKNFTAKREENAKIISVLTTQRFDSEEQSSNYYENKESLKNKFEEKVKNMISEIFRKMDKCEAERTSQLKIEIQKASNQEEVIQIIEKYEKEITLMREQFKINLLNLLQEIGVNKKGFCPIL
jgi:GTP-binding protein EngB required for normal cell division